MHSRLARLTSSWLRLSLRTRLIALVLAISVPSVTYQAWQLGREFKRDVDRELQGNLELAAAAGAACFNYIDNLWSTEYALGTAITHDNHPATKSQIEFLLAEQLPINPTVRAFSWINADGTITASTYPDAVNDNVANLEWFRRIKAGEAAVVSNLMTSRMDKTQHSIVVARAIRKDKQLFGVVIAGVDVEKLNLALDLRSTNHTIGLIDKNAVIVYSNTLPQLTGAMRHLRPDSPGYKALASGKAGVEQRYKSADGEPYRMVAYSPIPRIGWVSYVSIPEAEVLALANERARLDRIVLILTALSAFICAIIVCRTPLKRLNTLREAAQAIEEGKLDTRIGFKGNDELARAGQAFDAMAARIEAVESDLTATKDRLAGIVETTLDGIVFVDREGNFTFANPAAERITGISREELCSSSLFNPALKLNVANGRNLSRDELLHIIDIGQLVLHFEFSLVRPDGKQIIISVNAAPQRDADGNSAGVVASFRDVTQRRNYERQLDKLANHDSLTGLYNRHRLNRELDQMLKDGRCGALFFLDLDQFKYVNDTFGHAKGDELLCKVANFLLSQLRNRAVLGRLGGDEFALILPGASIDEATRFSTRILEELRHCAIVINNQVISASASIGIAHFPTHGCNKDELMVRADLAMYQAKEAGRNRWCVYSEATADRQAQVERRINSERELRSAIENDRLTLYAQPLLDLDSLEVSIFEVLLRITTENGQIVLPQEFLPIAEQSDLILEINRWVTKQAISLIGAHTRQLTLSINLSARVFSDRGFIAMVQNEIRKNAINPACLIFEVTETAAIVDMEQACSFLKRLRAMGCHIALDDFGSGFSSLTYMRKLPIDFVKLDGVFIRELPTNPVDQMLVRAIASVAKELGVKTTAEFVSDAKTINLLQEYCVDFAQGYYIGRPLPVHEALASLYNPLSTAAIKGDTLPL